MTILIGLDEAGYGPNLGPLCVAASAWSLGNKEESGKRKAGEIAALPVDLYQRLAGAVSRKPESQRIAIGDSKTLYKPGGGLRLLERGVVAAMIAGGGDAPARWGDLLSVTRADVHGCRHALPWHDDFDCRLPIDAARDEVATIGQSLHATCQSSGVAPVAMRAKLVFPREFNEQTERYGSKGAALSHVTLGLLREILDSLRVLRCDRPRVLRCDRPRVLRCSTAGVTIVCDKHGGRNRYGELLQHHFPAATIDTLVESRAESRYRWVAEGSMVDIRFRTKGESFLPTALASMMAKYLRELSMRAFNQFWRGHLPDLKPTAGYPVDAKRFKAQIDAVQRQLGIVDRDLWRSR